MLVGGIGWARVPMLVGGIGRARVTMLVGGIGWALLCGLLQPGRELEACRLAWLPVRLC